MARSPHYSFIGKVKIQGEDYEYTISPSCKICSDLKPGTGHHGKDAPIEKKISRRPEIDRYIIEHNGSYKSPQFAKKLNYHFQTLKIGQKGIATHVEKHSPYILEVKEKLKNIVLQDANKASEVIEDKHYEAEEVIQKIINKAGQAIDSGEMKVDNKLTAIALKEQGLRQKYGTLTQMLESMDQDRFLIKAKKDQIEGEVLLDESEPAKEFTTNIQG